MIIRNTVIGVLAAVCAGSSGIVIGLRFGPLSGIVAGLVGCLIGGWAGRCAGRELSIRIIAGGAAPGLPREAGAVGSAVVVLALVLGMVSFSRGEAWLTGLHQPGTAAYGVNDAEKGELLRAVVTWSAWRPPARGRTWPEARYVVSVEEGLDSMAIVPGYLLLLTLLIVHARRAVHREADAIAAKEAPYRDTSRRQGLPAIQPIDLADRLLVAISVGLLTMALAFARRVTGRDLSIWRPRRPARGPSTVNVHLGWGRAALAAAVIAALADWCENALLVGVVDVSWATGGRCDWPACSLMAKAVNVCGLIKVSGVVLATAYVAAVAWLWLKYGGARGGMWARLPRLKYTGLRLLLPCTAALLYAGIMLVPNQAGDIFRLWIDEPNSPSMWLGLLFTVLLAGTIGLGAWWMLLRPARPWWRRPRTPGVHPPGPPGGARWLLAAGLLWYAIVWLTEWLAALGTTSWWAGLAASAAAPIMLMLTVAGRPRRRMWLPLVIEGAVALALGVTAWREAGTADTSQPILPLSALKALFPLVALAAVYLLGKPFQNLDGSRLRVPYRFGAGPAILAGVVLTVYAVSMLETGLDMLFFAWGQPWQTQGFWLFFALAAVGLVALAMLTALITDLPNRSRRVGRGRRPGWAMVLPALLLTLGVSLSLCMTGLLAVVPGGWLTIARTFGAVALTGLALSLLVLFGAGLQGVVEQYLTPDRIPPLFRLLGFGHVPAMSVVGIWFLLASVIPMGETLRNIRMDPPPLNAALDDHSIRGAFNAWLDRHYLRGMSCPAGEQIVPGNRPVAPLVLLATAGGGIRAAAWTLTVMDSALPVELPQVQASCAAPPDPQQGTHGSWVFLASGVSGGSVGLASYAARQGAVSLGSVSPPGPDDAQWPAQHLNGDALSPSMGWMLFPEAQWSLLRFPLPRDRAAVMEETWEQSWFERIPNSKDGSLQPPQFFDLQGRPSVALPLLLLNGTSVESGCRFNVSRLAASGRPKDVSPLACMDPPQDNSKDDPGVLGATVDLVRFLCRGQDLPLSTAALLSARYPGVSPWGAVTQQKCPAETAQSAPTSGPEGAQRTFVVDGGYHEGSGVATILDVWSALAPLVEQYNTSRSARAWLVPFLITIGNDYHQPATAAVVPEPQLIAPISGRMKAQDAAEQRVKQEVSFIFNTAFPLPDGSVFGCRRYAHFDLQAHPGPEAPLGWILSSLSFKELNSQLHDDGNLGAGRLVRGWLSEPDLQRGLHGECPDLRPLPD